jgi:hypothetical protein
VIRLVRNHQTD